MFLSNGYEPTIWLNSVLSFLESRKYAFFVIAPSIWNKLPLTSIGFLPSWHSRKPCRASCSHRCWSRVDWTFCWTYSASILYILELVVEIFFLFIYFNASFFISWATQCKFGVGWCWNKKFFLFLLYCFIKHQEDLSFLTKCCWDGTSKIFQRLYWVDIAASISPIDSSRS